jgi:two-component system, NarL family, response regulator NreC
MSSQPVRLLLADDHQVVRQGLRALFEGEPDFRVVAEARDGAEAVRLSRQTRPHVAIIDLGMPGVSGLEAIRAIRHEMPDIRIVVLSMHCGREIVTQALEAGCDGYVPKSAAHASLLQAVRTVQAGQRFLEPAAATALVDELCQKRYEASLLSMLSDRERDILRMTALGFTSREIGEQLAISPKTADTYRQRAMDKLGLQHRSEIVRFALQAGLLAPETAV